MSARHLFLTAGVFLAPVALCAQTTASSATTPAAATATATPSPVVHPRVGNEIELGRKYTQWLYTGQFDSLFAHMSEDARKEMESPSAMAAKFDEFTAEVGEETKMMGEIVVMRKGNPQYWRTAEFSMAPEPVMIRWVIVNGEIWGIGINPASQAPPIDPEQ